MEKIIKIGRRKAAVARCFINQGGAGIFQINGRELADYMPTEVLRIKVNQPFAVLGLTSAEFDIKVNVYGGGVNGQAESIRLAIARALVEFNEENRPALKKAGFLTRDPRVVERKKYGHKKARKNFQFSKR
jgi:small subunit ribosomal protein S9